MRRAHEASIIARVGPAARSRILRSKRLRAAADAMPVVRAAGGHSRPKREREPSVVAARTPPNHVEEMSSSAAMRRLRKRS